MKKCTCQIRSKILINGDRQTAICGLCGGLIADFNELRLQDLPDEPDMSEHRALDVYDDMRYSTDPGLPEWHKGEL